MSDIVEKLHDLAKRFGRCSDHETCVEAANEIERLQAREARLQEALEKIIHEDLWSTKHPDGVVQRGQSIFDGYFGGIARAALEGQEEK